LHDGNAVEPPQTVGCPGKLFPIRRDSGKS